MDHGDIMLFLLIVAGIVSAAIVIDVIQMIESSAKIKPQISI